MASSGLDASVGRCFFASPRFTHSVMAKPIRVRAGQLEFLRLNAEHREWRDTYHWVLSLRWSHFVAFIAAVYVVINLCFAVLYTLGGNCVANMTPGSFPEAFFYSVQTLATVGYGHLYPQTAYGNIVTTIEVMSGVFWLAVMTGLIFVRFSRPTARILFSKSMVIAPFNGLPTLMLRVANLRHRSMVEADFRIVFTRDETTLEGEMIRRFYPLKMDIGHAIIFPAALTLRHIIDASSPLHGANRETLMPSTPFSSPPSYVSRQSFPRPCKSSRTIVGKTSVSANGSSKSTRTGTTAGSSLITADYTTQNR